MDTRILGGDWGHGQVTRRPMRGTDEQGGRGPGLPFRQDGQELRQLDPLQAQPATPGAGRRLCCSPSPSRRRAGRRAPARRRGRSRDRTIDGPLRPAGLAPDREGASLRVPARLCAGPFDLGGGTTTSGTGNRAGVATRRIRPKRVDPRARLAPPSPGGRAGGADCVRGSSPSVHPPHPGRPCPAGYPRARSRPAAVTSLAGHATAPGRCPAPVGWGGRPPGGTPTGGQGEA